MTFAVLSVMATANGIMAVYNTSERNIFEMSLHWLSTGLFFGLIFHELTQIL